MKILFFDQFYRKEKEIEKNNRIADKKYQKTMKQIELLKNPDITWRIAIAIGVIKLK